ncbi:hypothetical protein GZL_08403 [Streptomyces sp. 769]|nr:hypothetical protein GZL_08403 [Streptomyces sp. 769]
MRAHAAGPLRSPTHARGVHRPVRSLCWLRWLMLGSLGGGGRRRSASRSRRGGAVRCLWGRAEVGRRHARVGDPPPLRRRPGDRSRRAWAGALAAGAMTAGAVTAGAAAPGVSSPSRG